MRRSPYWLMLMAILFIVYGLFLAFCLPIANGQSCPGGTCPQPAAVANPAIVRVAGIEADGTGYGTGTIFARRDRIAYVITAAHVVREAKKVSVLAAGRWHGADVRMADETRDVAVLAIVDPGISPLPLATDPPATDEKLELSGFASGRYHWAVAPVVRWVSPGNGTGQEWMELGAPSQLGDSGGPLVNRRGQVVGIISGTGQGATVGCCFPRARVLLARILGCCPPRPQFVTPQPIPPQLPQPDSPPTPPVIPSDIDPPIDYDRLAEIIYAKVIADIDKFRGPPGPSGMDGAQGPPGDRGSQGPPGEIPQIDLDALAEAVAARLPPIIFQALDSEGNPAGKPIAKHLGETLQIRSFLVEKP